jgi:RND family efflux transporter MFP subunit
VGLPAVLLPACLKQTERTPRQNVASKQPPDDSRPVAESGTEQAPTAVAVPIKPGEAAHRFSVDTNLVVDQDVALMARMSGIVDEILVDRGSRVKKGDILLKLKNRDLDLLRQRAEITARQKTADFERAQQLFAERTISPSQFEEFRFALDGAEVDVEIAREEYEKSLVRAPFDGLIVDRFAKSGQKVVEDRNEPLFRLAALSPLQARLYLPEEVAREVRQGDRVEVRPRYRPDVSATGTIEWISRVIDASSGTSQAIVSVPGSGRAGPLAPGVAVSVVLSLSSANAGVLIPPAALAGHLEGATQQTARVEVLADGKRSWREVRLGEIHDGSVEILEGLRAGERVILSHGGEARAVERR